MPIARRLRRLFFDQAAAWCVLFRRPDRALEFYGKMLALDPGDTLALSSIGYQTAQQGRRREALAIFDRLLTVAPGDAEAHFNRGYLLQELGDHGRAMEAFERAIGINPESRPCALRAARCRSSRRGASRRRSCRSGRTRSCSR